MMNNSREIQCLYGVNPGIYLEYIKYSIKMKFFTLFKKS
jgi:hypothetical protein